ncbi:restriction endonuclease [Acanthopleuribacter pedis]|uniref:Restriction endonuclease n=1 Tax=Acanthopleuribacter pedis TaxID=442870 RepID=A0A8J7U8B6_9BACT|nr:winged helix-turn-helix domain-containing protein [Acanthopleuribacter pedis]MBO1323413.1 restriction endonuclease [Acanthopleuribacter pedis]
MENSVTQQIPNFKELMNPLIKALVELGGSAEVREARQKVIEQQGYDEEVTSVLLKSGAQTKFSNRLGWARKYLVDMGYMDGSTFGVWTLTPTGRKAYPVNPEEVAASVRRMSTNQGSPEADQSNTPDTGLVAEVSEEESTTWQTKLHEILHEDTFSAEAFARLAQRLLRESGFIQLNVDGRAEDGSIEGNGTLRLNPLVSAKVFFQVKHTLEPVTKSQVRDFRGAMLGRGNHGLIITTGSFTTSAIEEAIRDGVPLIDLVDGEQLAERLKELELGVMTEMVEQVTIDVDWFDGL